ncbi:MAG: nuclear transport factor 2 family protein [Planctomycetota bacterium]
MSQPAAAVLLTSLLACCVPLAAAGQEDEVDALLSRMHEASKHADTAYFDLFADDAVFFGTDLWERWPIDAFEALYKPYMESGRGWELKARDRRIDIQPCGTIALFDEAVFSDSFGPCRGSGAARLDDGEWKIVRYHLDITIPNGVVDEIVPIIRTQDRTAFRYVLADIKDVQLEQLSMVIAATRPEILYVIHAEPKTFRQIEAIAGEHGLAPAMSGFETHHVFYAKNRFQTIEHRDITQPGYGILTLRQLEEDAPALRVVVDPEEGFVHTHGLPAINPDFMLLADYASPWAVGRELAFDPIRTELAGVSIDRSDIRWISWKPDAKQPSE